MEKTKLLNIVNKIIIDTYLETIQNIYKKCKDNNIEILIFKGIALSIQLYENPYGRRSGDIDCVIKREDLMIFLKILKDDGFTLGSNEEINISDYEIYFFRSHLKPFYKTYGKINVVLEVHVNTLYNPEQYYSFINLFENKQEIMINNEDKIYTLSYNLNFSSLIIHYIKHMTEFIKYFMSNKPIDFGNKTKPDSLFCHHYLKEISVFYLKYKEYINLKSVLEIFDKNDSIEYLELFNHYYFEMYGIKLYPPDELTGYRNINLYYQKNLCRYLLNISFEEFINSDYNDIFIKFRSNYVSVKLDHPLKKFLGGEVPGEKLPPIVGGFHNGGLLKDTGQVLGRVPAVCLRRFY